MIRQGRQRPVLSTGLYSCDFSWGSSMTRGPSADPAAGRPTRGSALPAAGGALGPTAHLASPASPAQAAIPLTPQTCLPRKMSRELKILCPPNLKAPVLNRRASLRVHRVCPAHFYLRCSFRDRSKGRGLLYQG